MEAFNAIERVLHFHHTTSRQPIRVAQLRLRCLRNGTAVSRADIDLVLSIWPDAYRQYVSRGNLVIEASDLPHNVEQRRAKFALLWSEKENCGNLPTAKPETPEDPRPQREPLKPTHMPILMGRLRKEPTNRSLSLLDRIRAKEASLKGSNAPAAMHVRRDQFLKSQIPRLKRILEGLTESKGSYSMDMQQVMDVLRTNLFKLGDDEIRRMLHLVVRMYPSFCSIVTVGSAQHVKLQRAPHIIY